MARVTARRGAAAPYEAQSAAYTARDPVAIKVIRPEYTEASRFRRRFEREVEAVRRVHGRTPAELLGSGFDQDERIPAGSGRPDRRPGERGNLPAARG